MFASIVAAIVFLVLGAFGLFKSNEATSQAATAQAASTLAFDNAATAQANSNVAATAQSNAQEQANIALARQLAAQAQTIYAARNSKQMTAVLLATQSLKMLPSANPCNY